MASESEESEWWGQRSLSVGAERSTQASHSAHQGPASRLTTHPVPPAARRTLEPASLQFNYCAAHWSREREHFEPCSPWRTAATVQYLLVTGRCRCARPALSTHQATDNPSFTLGLSNLVLFLAVCPVPPDSAGPTSAWLQLRSAANVGCAHPIQSTRRRSYIIAFP